MCVLSAHVRAKPELVPCQVRMQTVLGSTTWRVNHMEGQPHMDCRPIYAGTPIAVAAPGHACQGLNPKP